MRSSHISSGSPAVLELFPCCLPLPFPGAHSNSGLRGDHKAFLPYPTTTPGSKVLASVVARHYHVLNAHCPNSFSFSHIDFSYCPQTTLGGNYYFVLIIHLSNWDLGEVKWLSWGHSACNRKGPDFSCLRVSFVLKRKVFRVKIQFSNSFPS